MLSHRVYKSDLWIKGYVIMKKLLIIFLLIAVPVQAQTYISTIDIIVVVTGNDITSGVENMSFSNDGVNWSEPEPFNTEKEGWELTPGDGEKTIFLKLQDRAGLWSNSIPPAVFTVDTVAPTGSVSIKIKVTVEGGG